MRNVLLWLGFTAVIVSFFIPGWGWMIPWIIALGLFVLTFFYDIRVEFTFSRTRKKSEDDDPVSGA